MALVQVAHCTQATPHVDMLIDIPSKHASKDQTIEVCVTVVSLGLLAAFTHGGCVLQVASSVHGALARCSGAGGPRVINHLVGESMQAT